VIGFDVFQLTESYLWKVWLPIK